MAVRGLIRAVTVALLLALCPGLAAADRVVINGRGASSRLAFQPAAGDVFVPISAFGPLLSGSLVTAETVILKVPARGDLVIYRDRPEAVLEGMVRPLPAAPKFSGEVLLIPAKAIAGMLGYAARWSDSDRVLYLHPWVRKFALETTEAAYHVIIGSEVPLSYSLSKLEGPPRLVVDLANADLAAIPTSFPVENSYLRLVRIAQRTLSPAAGGEAVRAVIEMTEWRPYRLHLSADRCRLDIELPLPNAELPPPAPSVFLTDLSFARQTPRVAALTLFTSGAVKFTTGAGDSPPTVWVELPNAASRLRPDRLLVSDPLISRVSVDPVPERPGVLRLTLTLTEASAYTVLRGRDQLRVVLGKRELHDLTVVIDAGHGGGDPGAVSRDGLSEKVVNLDIARRVARLLEESGAHTLLTRADDDVNAAFGSNVRLDQLYARCEVANQACADLFVAIHCNAAGRYSKSKRGTETYYRKEDSIDFARVMQEEMVRSLGLPDNGALRHSKSIVVLYRTLMPAVLVEVAYLSNKADADLLCTPEFREQAAQGIANGIRRYAEETSLSAAARQPQAEGTPAPAEPSPAE